MSENYFDHEKLILYQKSIEFVEWACGIQFKTKNKNSIMDQFDRASSIIALNIAEGNRKFTGKDRCKYFDISRGSALECASCLDIMHVKNLITINELDYGKKNLKEIVSMIVGLIKANSDRVHEDQPEYNSSP